MKKRATDILGAIDLATTGKGVFLLGGVFFLAVGLFDRWEDARIASLASEGRQIASQSDAPLEPKPPSKTKLEWEKDEVKQENYDKEDKAYSDRKTAYEKAYAKWWAEEYAPRQQKEKPAVERDLEAAVESRDSWPRLRLLAHVLALVLMFLGAGAVSLRGEGNERAAALVVMGLVLLAVLGSYPPFTVPLRN